jgi:hypothetical protein
MKTKEYVAAAAMVVLGLGGHATEGAAAPQVINQCQTLAEPGSYVLGKNLAASGIGRGGFDCLHLGDDFITIDFNGFTITGKSGKGSGIKLSNDFGGAGRGFEIRGGTILNFARGIDLRVLGGSPGQNRLERMRIEGNSDVGVFMTGNAIVKDSIFSRNGICPILDGCPERTTNGDGLHVGNNSVVTGNTSTGNAGHGIAGGGTVIGNTAIGNAGSGLQIAGGSTVVHNTADGNGVGLSIGCPTSIIGNTAVNNTTNLLAQGAGCNLVDNSAP